MLTKRAFLATAGALATFQTVAVRAGDQPHPTVTLATESLRLTSEGSPVVVPKLVGTEPDGALHLGLGQASEVSFHNTWSEPATLVVRGMRGVGDLGVAPGETLPGMVAGLPLSPRDSGTSLLRLRPVSAQPIAQGACQAVVVPEPGSPVADRDFVVLLDDWLLARDNTLRFGSLPPADAVASIITVNGASTPQNLVVAPRTRLRLRFANGSTQRLMVVSCVGGRPMIAAIDGQPSDLFAPARNSVPIGPGARYDMLLDAPDAAGAQIHFTLKPTVTVADMLEPERDLLVIRTEGAPLPARPPFAPLPANPALPRSIPLEAARRVDLSFGGQPGTSQAAPTHWSVNGVPGHAADRPVLSVRRGEAVVLGLVNASATLVPLRIGGHAVRLLHARDDGWEPYWRDSLLLPPKSSNHVAFVADIEGRWPIDSGFDDLTLAGLSCFFTVRQG